MSVGGEIARSGRIDKGHRHQEREKADEGVIVLNDKRSIAKGVFECAAYGRPGRGGGAEEQRAMINRKIQSIHERSQ